MLLAKDVVAAEADFINVLEHIPGTKSQKQAYFHSRGIRVPRTNYESMWEVLTHYPNPQTMRRSSSMFSPNAWARPSPKEEPLAEGEDPHQ